MFSPTLFLLITLLLLSLVTKFVCGNGHEVPFQLPATFISERGRDHYSLTLSGSIDQNSGKFITSDGITGEWEMELATPIELILKVWDVENSDYRTHHYSLRQLGGDDKSGPFRITPKPRTNYPMGFGNLYNRIEENSIWYMTSHGNPPFARQVTFYFDQRDQSDWIRLFTTHEGDRAVDGRYITSDNSMGTWRWLKNVGQLVLSPMGSDIDNSFTFSLIKVISPHMPQAFSVVCDSEYDLPEDLRPLYTTMCQARTWYTFA